MADRLAVPPDVLAKLRAICLGLPEAVEEQAWAGTRWTVRGKNFAHVVMVDGGWPPAYAKAAGTPGPACVLTFRLPLAMVESPRLARHPFFRPPWFANIVGLRLDGWHDWDEVEGLLTDSWRELAPRKLAEQLGR